MFLSLLGLQRDWGGIPIASLPHLPIVLPLAEGPEPSGRGQGRLTVELPRVFPQTSSKRAQGRHEEGQPSKCQWQLLTLVEGIWKAINLPGPAEVT